MEKREAEEMERTKVKGEVRKGEKQGGRRKVKPKVKGKEEKRQVQGRRRRRRRRRRRDLRARKGKGKMKGEDKGRVNQARSGNVEGIHRMIPWSEKQSR